MTEGNIVSGSMTAAPREWDANILLEFEIKEVFEDGSYSVKVEMRYIDADTNELYKKEQFELAQGSVLTIKNLRSVAKKR